MNRLRPTFYLALSLTLFAAGNSLVKWLVREGGTLGLTEPGAISFCNVLFVGNMCGAVLALILSGPRATIQELGGTTWRDRGLLFASTLLAVTIASLLFTALATTTVTSLILLSRIEPVAFAVFSGLIFGSRVSRRQWLGFAVILGGGLTLVLEQSMYRLMTGDLLVIAAAVCQGYTVCLSKQILERVGRHTLVVVRTFGAAVIFFVVVIVWFGAPHFAQAFGPGLWAVMTVYALVSVVLAQFAWYRALDAVPDATVAKGLMVSPAIGILAAFLLLGEVPDAAQWIAAGIILTGMLLSYQLIPERPVAAGCPEQRLGAA